MYNSMKNLFVQDYERFTPNKYSLLSCIVRLIRNHELRFLFWGRLYETTQGGVLHTLAFLRLRKYKRKYGLEATFLPGHIQGGFRLVHPFNITVNAHAYIGKNVTLNKGCTIGVIDRGLKAGNPKIKNNVTIFANATVCGNITIGDNVDIAPGAFVNFDVPANSIVIGNPGTIHLKKHTPINSIE